MKSIWLAGLVLTALAANTWAAERYQEIRISDRGWSRAATLAKHPDLEFMGDDDGSGRYLSYPSLTEALRAEGVPVEVEIDDLGAFYTERLQTGARGGGNFGIFHTYSETVTELNDLHAEYPAITTAPQSIGTSGEGRTIWAIKVSDQPNVDENEAEVLFDGVHHAREIMTVEVNLAFARYLCENYGSDPAATQIVNSREVWFVPIVNTDGFAYNEQTNPGGGGLWRKNRRNNGGGCFGVDPNRNYPYEWNGSGSSTDPCNDTYRGPSPGSEPEIQALTNFINAHDFVVWQSYHSVSAMVLFPWGYTFDHTPDDATFRALAAEMASTNGYQTGQPPEILYNVNGAAFDWGYGETSQHTKIFAFTTEIGGSGFWPLESERQGLIDENLHANLYLCQIAGAYIDVLSLVITGGNGNGKLDPGETDSAVATIKNAGLLTPATNVRVVLSCDDPYVTLSDAVTVIGNLGAGQTVTTNLDPFDLTVDPTCPNGRQVNLAVTVTADGGLSTSETTAFTVGTPSTVLSNDFELPANAWTIDPSQTTTAGAFVRVDPNPTSMQPGDDTTPAPGVFAWITGQNSSEGVDDVDNGVVASRSPAWNLSAYSHVRMQLNYFFGQRDPGDDAADFFRLDLSNNGGSSFPVNLLLKGDIASAPSWTSLSVDLEDFLPLTSQMMLRVQVADGVSTGDLIEGGLDDVVLYDMGAGNEPPGRPVLLSPLDGAQNLPAQPVLRVLNAVDPEGDPLVYGFRVYRDAELTDLAASVNGIAQGSGSTSWTVTPPLANGTYHWRAFAADAGARGRYMDAASFEVDGATATPLPVDPTGLALRVGPNPSRGATRIHYQSADAPWARVEVIDAEGRRVRSLGGGRAAAGWQELEWDGKDGSGQPVPAGVYHIRLVVPGEERTLRVIRLR